MKKFLSIILCILILISLNACSNTASIDNSSDNETSKQNEKNDVKSAEKNNKNENKQNKNNKDKNKENQADEEADSQSIADNKKDSIDELIVFKVRNIPGEDQYSDKVLISKHKLLEYIKSDPEFMDFSYDNVKNKMDENISDKFYYIHKIESGGKAYFICERDFYSTNTPQIIEENNQMIYLFDQDLNSIIKDEAKEISEINFLDSNHIIAKTEDYLHDTGINGYRIYDIKGKLIEEILGYENFTKAGNIICFKASNKSENALYDFEKDEWIEDDQIMYKGINLREELFSNAGSLQHNLDDINFKIKKYDNDRYLTTCVSNNGDELILYIRTVFKNLIISNNESELVDVYDMNLKLLSSNEFADIYAAGGDYYKVYQNDIYDEKVAIFHSGKGLISDFIYDNFECIENDIFYLEKDGKAEIKDLESGKILIESDKIVGYTNWKKYGNLYIAEKFNEGCVYFYKDKILHNFNTYSYENYIIKTEALKKEYFGYKPLIIMHDKKSEKKVNDKIDELYLLDKSNDYIISKSGKINSSDYTTNYYNNYLSLNKNIYFEISDVEFESINRTYIFDLKNGEVLGFEHFFNDVESAKNILIESWRLKVIEEMDGEGIQALVDVDIENDDTATIKNVIFTGQNDLSFSLAEEGFVLKPIVNFLYYDSPIPISESLTQTIDYENLIDVMKEEIKSRLLK